MTIQLFKPKFRTNKILKNLRQVFDIGWTGIGFKTNEFEEKWNSYTKLKHSIFTNSATAGLHIACETFKINNLWNEDSEIITSPISFVSTAHSILYSKLKLVFSDIDYTGTLDPNKIIHKINKKTKAIIFVGLGGNIGNLDKIANIAKKFKIKLIIDAAHMAGSFYKKKHVGYQGDAVIFSFQAVKNLPTGDSGIINFKNKKDFNLAKKLSWCGIDKDTFSRGRKSYSWEYNVSHLGYKYNGNSIMASIALTNLEYLNLDNKKRNFLSDVYYKYLSKNSNIKIINHKLGSSRHLFSILVNKREKVIKILKKNNISTGVHYKSINEFSFYKKNYSYENLEVSKIFSKKLLTLPLHCYLNTKDIKNICSILNNIT